MKDKQQSTWNHQYISLNSHWLFYIVYYGVYGEVKKFQTSSLNWILNMYWFHWLVEITHIWGWSSIQCYYSGQLLKFGQTSHHEWENIHDLLKLDLDDQNYRLKHIHLNLQSTYLRGQLYISSSDQYHKDRDNRIFPKSEWKIFGQFFYIYFPPIFNRISKLSWNGLWFILK